MEGQFDRTKLLFGEEAINSLKESKVAIFGIGGVGGFVVEALARSGIGSFDLIDNDVVCESNINRQIIATWDTIGRQKTEAMRERIALINPKAVVDIHNCFYLPETSEQFNFTNYNYIVDAVDTVTAKLDIVCRAKEAGVPVISCMGAGNKIDPLKFEVADIYDTVVCPLARVMRRELRKRNIDSLKVVYSREEPVNMCLNRERGSAPGSVAYVPSVAGMIIAGEVIKDLILENKK